MKKIILVGCGDRGHAYTKYALAHPDEMQVCAIVEPNDFRRKEAQKLFNVSPEYCFTNVDDCVKLGRFADGVINATMDSLHIVTATPFLKLGYTMMLEKPVTNNKKELDELKRCADEHGAKLMICHVLRYTPFYLGIKKVLLSGEIGDIVAMETSETVSVAHASCSYIRGKWNNRKKCGSSMLLAKCCHDADLLCWFNSGTAPKKVASMGGRHYFIPANTPEGAGKRCLVDCKIEKDCPYSCRKVVLENDFFPQLAWDCIEKPLQDITMEEKIRSLETFNEHGKCIFKTDADIVDRQMVLVEFENGSIASHSMISGVARAGRRVHIVGTRGEVEGFMEEGKYKVRTYNPDTLLYNEREVEITGVEQGDGHGGGDSRIVKDFLCLLNGEPRSVSSTVIEDSLNGHYIVYAADRSLDEGGVAIDITE